MTEDKGFVECGQCLPVMPAVAVRKKVVSISHFSKSFYFQLLQIFLFGKSNQKQLYVLIALKIREQKSLKIHSAKNICHRAFCLAPNERELSNLLTLSISLEA